MEHFKKSPASNQPRQLPCSAYPSTEEEVRESTFHPTAPAHSLFRDLPSTGDAALEQAPASKQHRHTPFSASPSTQDDVPEEVSGILKAPAPPLFTPFYHPRLKLEFTAF